MSILFSSELPYRIDFFGNDVDTIRTFEVETQLSKDKKEKVEIVPELATLSEEENSFFAVSSKRFGSRYERFVVYS